MTTTRDQREWVEIAGCRLAQTVGVVLWVEDGTVGHMTALAADTGAEIESALADYASGYDAGGRGQPIRVAWELWVEGEEKDRGGYRFDSAQ